MEMEMEKVMTTTTWKKIPRKVLDLLGASRWQDEAKVFESNFEDRGDRKQRPSWYGFRRDQAEPTWGSAFSGAEAWELHKQGAFGEHVVEHKGSISVNEHAAHALGACLAEMSAAWDKYQERLAQIPAARVTSG
jgi:hypothetical protein